MLHDLECMPGWACSGYEYLSLKALDTASTTATVISTAGDAVPDSHRIPAPRPPRAAGLNGGFALRSPLLIGGSPLPAAVRSYSAPASNDVVPIAFTQPIDATEPLRTGSYSKTLTFTLATTNP